jgi:predicted O-linked N-acetylglucosamine transferase (SPINDLY family)
VLRRIGLADWVGSDTDAYVRRACAAAADLDALAALRAGLRARMSDSAISRLDFVSAELDAALRTMWRRWCAGLPAETFAVTP